MAGQVPLKFRKSSDAIVNYNYTDLASGLGFITFYGCTMKETTNLSYALITQTLFAEASETTRSTTGTTTMNFDSSVFNQARVAKGTAYFSANIKVATSGTVSLKIQIMKVASDGMTTTNISSEITSKSVTGAPADDVVLVPIPLTQVTIGKGELLRCVVKLVDAGNDVCGVSHDPANRANAAYSLTRIMRLEMPFKIEI